MGSYMKPDRTYSCYEVARVFEFDCCGSCHEDRDYGYSLCDVTKELANGDWVSLEVCCKCLGIFD